MSFIWLNGKAIDTQIQIPSALCVCRTTALTAVRSQRNPCSRLISRQCYAFRPSSPEGRKPPAIGGFTGFRAARLCFPSGTSQFGMMRSSSSTSTHHEARKGCNHISDLEKMRQALPAPKARESRHRAADLADSPHSQPLWVSRSTVCRKIWPNVI